MTETVHQIDPAFGAPWPAAEAPKRLVRAYLGLGTNIGDRASNLETAITLLSEAEGIQFQCRSQAIVTAPWGKTDQPSFLNAAIGIDTTLSPIALLDRCLSTERKMGRVRDEKWGPRIIDIDVLLYGTHSVSVDGLSVPHPLIAERDFVLEPLREIAPHIVPSYLGYARD